MPIEPATMAPGTWAERAQEDEVPRCQEPVEATLSLSGSRTALAAGVVAAAVILIAAPALVVLIPGLSSGLAAWIGRLAGLTPVMLGARALLFVVALVVIARPAAGHDGAD